MTARHTAALLAAAVLLAAAPAATAQPSACDDPDAPWRAPCPGVQPAATLVPPPPPAPPVIRSLRDRTHNSIFPTGNLMPAGEVEFHMHELGLYNRAAFGLTDRIELSVGAPLIPVVVSAGARVSATPRDSSFKLVAGAGVWSPINDDDQGEYVYQLGLTAGYQGERFEIHATVSRLAARDDDEGLASLSAGLSYQTGAKSALIVEAGHVGIIDGTSSCSGDCVDEDWSGLDGLLVGVKLMGARFDTDLGLLLVGDREDRQTFTLPIVSMSYRY